MIKLIGTVKECFVDDVSKTAGKRVPVSHLSLAVERTEPQEMKTRFLPVEQFRASLPSPFAELDLAEGTRIEVTTSTVPTTPRLGESATPLDIQQLNTLP
jgi:hypothetical protein